MQLPKSIRKYCDVTRSQENALAGALFVIGLVTVYSWGIRPHVTFLQAAQRYERAAEEYLDRSEAVNDDLADRSKVLDDLRAKRATFSAAAFSPTEGIQFHDDLQTRCRDNACEMVSLSYGKDESVINNRQLRGDSPVVLRTATLTVHGTYGSVISLLESIQSPSRRVWLDRFQMVTLPLRPGWVTCDMTITICVDHEKESR